eukprot:gene7691-7161_t
MAHRPPDPPRRRLASEADVSEHFTFDDEGEEQRPDGRHRMTERALYGGAMRVTVDAAFVDASDFRQIPGHQEVPCATHDIANAGVRMAFHRKNEVFVDDRTDSSFIVEIVE